MKFATLGHLITKKDLDHLPPHWIHDELIFSPEIDIYGTKGFIAGLKLTAQQLLNIPLDKARKLMFNAVLYLQDEYHVDLIQLGALTTSLTSGGTWMTNQSDYKGFVNHGDSYTAAVTCQAVQKSLQLKNKNPSDCILAIVGAYGVIGEAVSKILVPQFKHSILIGRREEQLRELEKKMNGSYETTVDLTTNTADIVVTATSHPTGLLNSNHLKKHAIIVDVSQPPNLSKELCKKRPDIFRIDGGYVDFPRKFNMPVPGMPIGKLFACIVEVIMQAMEGEHKNFVGSIDLNHLRKTEQWAQKYGFTLNELTNFGKPIDNTIEEQL
jgi:predicted amino acid dehydrogenase